MGSEAISYTEVWGTKCAYMRTLVDSESSCPFSAFLLEEGVLRVLLVLLEVRG